MKNSHYGLLVFGIVVLFSTISSIFCQVNLLVDPGFENNGQGWLRTTNGGRSMDSTEANSGIASQRMILSNQYAREVQQDIAALPNQNYDVSVWSKVTNPGTAIAGMVIIWFNTSTPSLGLVPSEIAQIDTIGTLDTTGNWTEISGTLASPANGVIVRMLLFASVDASNSGGTVWFDDASLKGMINTGLIGYWPFEETTGNTAFDSSGNSNHGTLVNAPTRVAGKLGQGISFDGVDDHITIVDNPLLHNLQAFTFSAWIFPTIDGHWHILDKGDGDKRLYAEGNALTLDGRVRYTGNHASNQSSDSVVKLDTWQYVTLTWSAVDHTSRIYLNGTEVSYNTVSTGTNNITPDQSHPYVIGARGALGPATFFTGVIDEVILYNRVLSDIEIKALANDGIPLGIRVKSSFNNFDFDFKRLSSGEAVIRVLSSQSGEISLSLFNMVGKNIWNQSIVTQASQSDIYFIIPEILNILGVRPHIAVIRAGNNIQAKSIPIIK